jgi:hypothetical protein
MRFGKWSLLIAWVPFQRPSSIPGVDVFLRRKNVVTHFCHALLGCWMAPEMIECNKIHTIQKKTCEL